MATKSFSKNLSMLNVIGLRESINDLMGKESKYVPVASICKAYLKKLDEGQHEGAIYESFINELSKVADHASTRLTISTLNKTINEHKRDIDVVNAMYEMQSSGYSYVVPMVESVIVDYLSNKNADTRLEARKKLSLFEGINSVNTILENLSFDEYEEKTGAKLANLSLNEALLPKDEPVVYTQEQLDEHVKAAKEQAINEAAAAPAKTTASIESHIGLDATIKNILNKERRNEALKTFCEQFSAALNAGKPEELLYESFISGLSNWNYLNAVDTEMNALKSRVSQYKQDIDLKKILETMLLTGSYYIVPLIESCVADYVDNKNMSTKAVLKQRLQAFEYDPFVRDILNIVMHDQSLESNVYLGESLETLNDAVHTEKIFSPVKYVKENECVFNVKGTYYSKKGNTITKLAKKSVENLDESFKMLCNLINHPAVSIDDLNDTISIYEGHDSAKISESSIVVNGVSATAKELADMANMSHLMNEHKEGFYKAINMLSENFNNIAYLDFVKRVAMNESNGKTVDVFRVKDKLFVTTINEGMGEVTFYRNVNPVQCRNCINEHMSINVSSLFEDILPDQKAILEGIEETRKGYEDALAKLRERKEKLEGLKEDGEDNKDIDDALKIVDEDIKSMEDDYKKYQEDTDKFINGAEDDATTETPDDAAAGAEPADASAGAEESPEEMSVPIEQGAEGAPEEDPDVAAALAAANSEEAAVAAATPFDSDFDVFSPEEIAQGNDAVQVLRVSYDANVKNGQKSNKGTAFVVIPSVNANGDVRDETKSITFYLDPSRKPILNNEDMPLSIYNAIVSAIAAAPDTAEVSVEPNVDDAISAATADEVPAEIGADAPEGGEVADILGTEEPDAIQVPEDVFGEGNETDDTAAAIDEPALDASLGAVAPIDADNAGAAAAETDDTLAPAEPATDADVENAFDAAATSNDSAPLAGEPAVEETPAETAEHADAVSYPIEIGMDMEDIKPIKSDDFEDAMSGLGIETSKVEGVDNGICIKLNDKSEVHAFRNYFKEWKNFSQAEFCNFFPELKNCFENKPAVPVMSEGIQIVGIKGINESVLLGDDAKGRVKLTLPYTEDYANMFGYPTDGKTPKGIEIVTEGVKDTEELYNKLHSYDIAKKGKIDEAARGFLDRYANDFENVVNESKYTLSVPYNGFLAQKLATKGITFTENAVSESMRIVLDKSEYAKARKIFEGFYGDKTPIEVKDFFQFSDELLSEGLKITIRDDKSGKTVELDTDDLINGDDSASADDGKEDDTNFEQSFEHTTFNPEESALQAEESDGDSSDDDKDKEADEKSEDENSEEPEEKKEVHKKRFTFKKKKHTDESVKAKAATALNESLNEGAQPNVYDWVFVPGGKKGQIIYSMPMTGNFIVNVDGRTLEYEPKSLKLAYDKKDTLDSPMKFDKDTLKVLFEQMVPCGMFMNGNQITPNNCYVKYSDYINAGENDDIRLVIEGENTMASRKYIRVLVDVNEFANPGDYCEGKQCNESGAEVRDVLVNIRDWNNASDITPVRCIAESQLVYIPAGSLIVTK